MLYRHDRIERDTERGAHSALGHEALKIMEPHALLVLDVRRPKRDRNTTYEVNTLSDISRRHFFDVSLEIMNINSQCQSEQMYLVKFHQKMYPSQYYLRRPRKSLFVTVYYMSLKLNCGQRKVS